MCPPSQVIWSSFLFDVICQTFFFFHPIAFLLFFLFSRWMHFSVKHNPCISPERHSDATNCRSHNNKNLCVYCIIGSKGRKHPYNLNSKLPLSSISVCLVFFSCDCFVCWGLLVLINNNADPSRPALKRRPSPDYTRN